MANQCFGAKTQLKKYGTATNTRAVQVVSSCPTLVTLSLRLTLVAALVVVSPERQ